MGTSFIIFGCLLRLLCYRTPGKIFTFKITIRQDHKIVDVGPYGIVRHPSYTGSLFLLSGAIILASGPETYSWACGLTNSSLILSSLLAWDAYVIYCIYTLLSRCPVEDRGLRNSLGRNGRSMRSGCRADSSLVSSDQRQHFWICERDLHLPKSDLCRFAWIFGWANPNLTNPTNPLADLRGVYLHIELALYETGI